MISKDYNRPWDLPRIELFPNSQGLTARICKTVGIFENSLMLCAKNDVVL